MNHNSFTRAFVKGMRLLFAATLVVTGVVAIASTGMLPAYAQTDTVDVTVTIIRVIDKDTTTCIDAYAKVRIGAFSFDRIPNSGDRSDCDFSPYWTSTRTVDRSLGTVSIEIQLWDADFGGDDLVDINPIGGVKELTLLFDLTTGTWTGDVPANQGFAEGFAGGAAKIFFDISLSSDGDTDGDGLLDGWELNGLHIDGDGIVDVDLPAFGADPMHKDLFLELDWMTGNAPTRTTILAMKQAFANAPIDAGTRASELDGGANAKMNPDGRPGINLWVAAGTSYNPAASEGFLQPAGSCFDGVDNDGDRLRDAADPDCITAVGDKISGGNELPASAIPHVDSSAFYAAKAANFNPARRWVFRYGISAAPGFEDGSAAGDSCRDGVDNGGGDGIDGRDPDCWPWGGGWGEIGGNDFIEYNHDGGTIMHELGHTLNLRHGGFEGANCKPNYVSVMNYDHQFGIPQTGGGTILDYSPPRYPGGRGLAPLPRLVEEDSLDENVILDATDATNRFIFTRAGFSGASGRKVQWSLNQPIDWNGDRDTNDSQTSTPPLPPINIDTVDNKGTPADTSDDRPAACRNSKTNSTLDGYDDWKHISLRFRQFGDAADGAINPVLEPEATLPELLQLEEILNTADVVIAKTDSADPVVAGEQLVFNLIVTNNGPNPASAVQVVDNLPAGVSYVGDTAGCTLEARTVTCDLGELLADDAREIMITTQIDADLVHEAGGSTTITNTATVDNLAGPDPDPSNDSASEDTRVVAEADLKIVRFEAVDPPTEILVGQPAQIRLRKVITNNGPSAPIDVALTKTATAPADSTVTPTASNGTELALGVSEQRVVEEQFSIECGTAGQHTFTFTNEIRPLRAADTDPKPINNQARVDLVVECVVPVAINIKPGSNPNSINLRDIVTVAVLTTRAGEYGTPLDFDATAIDPLSARFGPRDAVWFETGGASETHNRGHVEDAFELDETTLDGDADMVLHFRASESGLQVGDTEACVKGEWVDTAGNRHKFFGCDAIRVVK